MTSIAFLDPVAAQPYGGEASHGLAQGGTEATVVRVAQQLSRLGHRVVVGQRARSRPERDSAGVAFLPYSPEHPLEQAASFSNVVVLRADKLMRKVTAQYPGSKRWLWLHCFPGRHRRGMVSRAAGLDFGLLTVSHALRKAVLDGSPGTRLDDERVQVVYNPVEVSGLARAGPRDKDKLVFFSSPHKGIAQVLQSFSELRREFPELRLHVANPGYIAGTSLSHHSGVVDLGCLDHPQVLRHVAEAFCVFYAQSSFAETFGLVFAEANALGTPVMAHALGSALEILGPEQLVDCDDVQRVTDLFRRWREHGPPAVIARAEFSLPAVTARWLELLRDP